MSINKIHWRSGVLCALLTAAAAVSALAAPMTSFPLSQTRLQESIFKQGMETNRKSLDDIGVETALYCFRYQAGLPTNGAKPLTSWASPEPYGVFPGFFEGHYLSAIALTYAQTGDPKMLEQVNYMVAELAKCQAASTDKKYMFASPQEEFNSDRLDGVAWYRMHKVLEGLLAAYNYAGNKQALTIATNLADWIKTKQDEYTAKDQWGKVKQTEPGGIQEALENLYIATGNPVHKAMARQWEELPRMLEPLHSGKDVVGGHANTYFAKMAGVAKAAETDKDEFHITTCKNFWEFVAGSGNRCYATGGTSIHESIPGANRIANTQARFAQETCCSYNFLKVTRSLFLITGDPKYMEVYERSLYNVILGSQDVHTGWKTYYQPLNQNTVKDFRSHLTGCYCCNGTGLESFSKFGDMIYTHDANTLFVNLFIPSTVRWPEKNSRIEQKTAFPDQSSSVIIVHSAKPVSMSIAVRVPGWCVKGFALSINGKPQALKFTPGSYTSIKRTWKDGDKIQVKVPMQFRSYPMPDKANQMAFAYGPLVMVGVGARPYMSELIGDTSDTKSWVNNLNNWFKPVPKQSLTFTATDTAKRTVMFEPYYRMCADEFFTGYFDVVKTPTIEADGNIALGKATTESRPQPQGVNVACFMRSARAVDGYHGGNDDWYLRWDGDGGLPQWWSVDLGAEYNLTKTEWFPPKPERRGAGKYYTYKIEYSTDNKSWSLYADKSNNSDLADPSYVDENKATARYLRVTFLPNSQQYGGASGSISEFKAYGTRR